MHIEMIEVKDLLGLSWNRKTPHECTVHYFVYVPLLETQNQISVSIN